MSNNQARAERELRSLREGYVRQLPQITREMENAWLLADRNDALIYETIGQLHQLAHRLYGSSASFGLSRLAGLFRSLEERLEPLVSYYADPPTSYQREEIGKMIAQLKVEAFEASWQTGTPAGDAAPDEEGPATVRETAPEGGATVDTPLILVVDDSDVLRKKLALVLGAEGFAVIEAANGKEAVERARERRPNLILMDVMMPVVDGFEAQRLLRAQDDTKDIPIVFLTSLSKIKGEDVRRVLSHGVAGFMPKPSPMEHIIKKVKAILLTSPGQGASSAGAKSKTILVVDDDEWIRAKIAAGLRGEGYKVLEAPNGLMALKQAMSGPDLILMDVMMPFMDGVETLRRLQVEKDLKDIPVVFLTAKNQPKDREAALMGGTHGYITKPTSLKQILRQVSVLLAA